MLYNHKVILVKYLKTKFACLTSINYTYALSQSLESETPPRAFRLMGVHNYHYLSLSLEIGNVQLASILEEDSKIVIKTVFFDQFALEKFV